MYNIVMFTKGSKIAILAIGLWTLNPVLATADKIYFNSGRKMEARVLSEEDDKVELAFPNGGTMTIQKSDIKRIEKADPSEINVNFVDGHNSMLVDCTINGGTKATLLIDTGASICMLSKKMAEELGIDTSDPQYMTKVQIADGSSVPAYFTKLKSLKIQHIEAKDVDAAILLQDLPANVSFKDGLLGMSFLGRYSTHVDYSRKKFIIEE